jgi:hypothetical protein
LPAIDDIPNKRRSLARVSRNANLLSRIVKSRRSGAHDAARSCLVAAIAAIGMKTQLKESALVPG